MEHLRQIQKAIDFIEDHLRNELTPEAIAQAAGFSNWHFQRLFRAAIGDTLKEYIRKRRLSAALITLSSSPDTRILDVALDAVEKRFTLAKDRLILASAAPVLRSARHIPISVYISPERRSVVSMKSPKGWKR